MSSQAIEILRGSKRESDLESKLGAKPASISSDKESGNVVVDKPQQAVPQFPEGGIKAWLVVAGCWCTSFASFGFVNSFGYVNTVSIKDRNFHD